MPYLTRLYIIWKKKILAEQKSPFHVSCLKQMIKFFTFHHGKICKNKNYVPPSKGKTVLVYPSKDKDGVLKQDWDVYMGHGLNNRHWVLEKS